MASKEVKTHTKKQNQIYNSDKKTAANFALATYSTYYNTLKQGCGAGAGRSRNFWLEPEPEPVY
jgi:hypothetical protein